MAHKTTFVEYHSIKPIKEQQTESTDCSVLALTIMWDLADHGYLNYKTRTEMLKAALVIDAHLKIKKGE